MDQDQPGWLVWRELEQVPDTIMLVEGAFDRLTLVAAGLPGITDCCASGDGLAG